MTASIGLYCDYEWARVLIQSSFPIGSFTGLMVMNLISDMQGRRRAFLIALAVTVGGILCI
jgi:MFS family permease